MQALASMLFMALLALCPIVVAAELDADHPTIEQASPAVSTFTSILAHTLTRSGTVKFLATQPTILSSDTELTIEERDHSKYDVEDQAETTIVVASVSGALSTILPFQEASPSGVYGGDSSTGNSPTSGLGGGSSTGPGSSNGSNPTGSSNGSNPTGSSPGSAPGSIPGSIPGSGPGSIPSSGSGGGAGNGGELSFPSGAYGQEPPSPTELQSPKPVGQQPQSPPVQLSPNPQGQQPSSTGGQQEQQPNQTEGQSPNPIGGQSPNSTGDQSANPTEQQPPSPTATNPAVSITTVPLTGTIAGTVTVSLESALGNIPLSTPSGSDTGVWGPLPAPITQPPSTTVVTVPAGSPLSSPCESLDNTPWEPLSAPNSGAGVPPSAPSNGPGAVQPTLNTGSWSPQSALNAPPPPTTFVTVPGAGGPAPIPTTSGTHGIVVITVPGSQEPLSALATTGDSITPNFPGRATVPGTTVAVPNSLQAGSSTAGLQISSTCTTGIYTDVISTSTSASSMITAAATLAEGTSTSSHRTTLTVSPASPVPIMSAGITIVEVNLSVLCGFIALAFFAGIGGTI